MPIRDSWRYGKTIATSSTTNFNPASNAANSTGLFSAQTYALRLCVNAPYNSVQASAIQGGGVVYRVLDPGEVVSVTATTGTFLPAAWVEVLQVAPGQRLSYLGFQTDASVWTLNVVELSN